MLKNTQANLSKLMKKNSSRKILKQDQIQLPFLVVTNNFSAINQNKPGDAIEMSFPVGTQYINNAFAYS